MTAPTVTLTHGAIYASDGDREIRVELADLRAHIADLVVAEDRLRDADAAVWS